MKLWNNSIIFLNKIIYLFYHSHLATVNFVLKGTGQYKNLMSILKLLFGRVIFLYLLTNLIKAILLSKSASCLPMHDRLPALNPVTTKGGKLSHSPFSHLSGLN